MSDQYEIDDTCSVCDGQMKFKLTKIDGHQRRHQVGTCQKCGFSEMTSICRCKVQWQTNQFVWINPQNTKS